MYRLFLDDFFSEMKDFRYHILANVLKRGQIRWYYYFMNGFHC